MGAEPLSHNGSQLGWADFTDSMNCVLQIGKFDKLDGFRGLYCANYSNY